MVSERDLFLKMVELKFVKGVIFGCYKKWWICFFVRDIWLVIKIMGISHGCDIWSLLNIIFSVVITKNCEVSIVVVKIVKIIKVRIIKPEDIHAIKRPNTNKMNQI